MSYKLDKPYTETQRADFIIEYNHRKGLSIEETQDAMYALEKNEIMKNGSPQIDTNYEKKQESERKKAFYEQFFKTSLGWIRRNVSMKDGSTKDFLADFLMQIKAGLELGQTVEIITYNLPDFSQEATEEYMVSLQERKNATPSFIQECLMQTVRDFGG